ncbi:MAG: glycosyltransferase [Nitrospirota bacterium]
MPTAVIDIECTQIPPEITGLEPNSRALVLVRFKGQPVGQLSLPLINGKISSTTLCDALMGMSDWPFWEYWLNDYIGFDNLNAASYAPPSATIAVCTRNRTGDLQQCIESLMRLPDDGQEILIVDNCPSSDDTYYLVQGFSNIRYVREDRIGLNVARNRALREAKNEIVAFIDDDAVADHRWLRALLRNFADPLVMCVTGLTMPRELHTEAQELFERYSPFGRGFRRTVFTKSNINPLAPGRVGAGANMALRTHILKLVGPFDEALDCGTPTHSGGDTEIFSRILCHGYRIVYEPAALCWHRHRRTMEELRRTLYGYGAGVYAFWTSCLLRGEFNVFRLARNWFLHEQIHRVVRAFLFRPDRLPMDLILSELRGCIAGPFAYLSSRRRVYEKDRNNGQ